MSPAIDFDFDFSSPYSYIASEEIEALAERHGSEIHWHPILLGAVFKQAGSVPLTEGYGPKARYSVRDFGRSAAFIGVPYQHPSMFPVGAVAAARAVLWLQRESPMQVAPFIHAVFRAFFVADRDISETAVVLHDCPAAASASNARATAGQSRMSARREQFGGVSRYRRHCASGDPSVGVAEVPGVPRHDPHGAAAWEQSAHE